METIKDTPAVILDIRGYPKGTIYAIAPKLTSKKVDVAITQTPYLQPSMLYSELESCVIEETHKLQPSAGWKYKGKVVVLINEETISHAEHSCLYLEAATDVTFVGTATNGANGNVTNCYLPGKIIPQKELIIRWNFGCIHWIRNTACQQDATSTKRNSTEYPSGANHRICQELSRYCARCSCKILAKSFCYQRSCQCGQDWNTNTINCSGSAKFTFSSQSTTKLATWHSNISTQNVEDN